MANLHLITGHGESNHINSADDGSLNVALFGSGSYVLNRGNKFSATIVSNNKIRIADGDLLIQGRHVRLNEGTSVELDISNGSQGQNRNDLIVARYNVASSGVEEVNLVVIKGTATSGAASDPAWIDGDIITDHDSQADFPLYRVPINGLNVGELVPLFTVISATISDALSGSDLASWAKAPNKPQYTASEVGASATGHKHDAADITSGILPVGKGGTGQTTGNAALQSMLAAGAMVLSSAQYGDSLPEPGTPGRIFFLKK